jgi:hypothetical protein
MVSLAVRSHDAKTTCPMARSVGSYWFARAEKK